jgi:hypothetical protein
MPTTSRTRRRRRRCETGLSLVEVAVASAILVVAALGCLRCQYYAAGHGDVAGAETAAARLAQVFLVDWKSTGGATDYDPMDLNLGLSGPIAVPQDFVCPSGLGAILNNAVYAITLNGTPIQMMLKYTDVTQDTQATATLRQLAVVTRFTSSGNNADARLIGLPPITLATYVRVDGSSG